MVPPSVRALAALSLVAAVACGGAIAPDGSTGSSSSSSSSGGSTPTPTHPGMTTPTPPSTSTPPPGPRPPESPTWATTAQGCGNFEIYFPDVTNREFIVVTTDKAQLGISNLGDSATVEIGGGNPSTSVLLDTFDAPAVDPPYCNDVVSSTPSAETRAVSGLVTFTISGVTNDLYQVDVTLHEVLVEDTNGVFQLIPDLTFKGVTVGWFAG